MSKTKITGIEAVLRKFSKAADKIIRVSVAGLKEGGKFLQNKSQEIVPKQIGTLHSSAFTRNIGGEGTKADIVVGYTADYAVFVHEDLTKAHGQEFNVKYAEEIIAATGKHSGTAEGGMFLRGDNQQAKFLEQPARQYRKEIFDIASKTAKGKM